MNGKFDGLNSDMKRVDAHVITPEEYEEVPELPPEFFAEGTLYSHGEPIKRRGRQKSPTKIPVTIRLDPQVVGFFRSQGKGWQTRMDQALREWISEHGQ
ncbi:MAG: BrnA antitoxin family protein [Magnetococcales bacterium]|nr:BrnA antitoxin family protein [Magnetococcales bacterium]MBF0157820.1 BrnA antitoxin family protein [Magnetococcales bacterium]